jgi:hypothetical protein
MVGSFFMTKIYRAEILLAPVHDDNSPLKSAMGGIGELASLAGVDMKMDDQTPEFVATLTSRLLIEPFIADNNLLPVLFYKRWDPDTHSWRKDMRVPTLQDGYYLLTKGVMSVVEDKLTGLITVKVDWKDPEQAAKWANGLVERVRQQARERAMRTHPGR